MTTPEFRPLRLEALDSLRGIFAVMIVLLHSSADWHLLNSALVRNSFIGVEFFFVLSGFVIAKSYGHRLQTTSHFIHFMIARIGRLWPLHVFMLTMFLLYYGVMYAVRGAGPFGIASPYTTEWVWEWMGRDALFLNAFANKGYFFANFPAWSINAEFWAYVLFGLIVFAFSSAPKIKNLALTIVALTALFVILGWVSPGFGMAWGASLFRAIFYFACGVLSFHVWKSDAMLRMLGTTASEAMLLVIWIGLLLVIRDIVMGPIAVAVIASLLVISFAHNRGTISRFLLKRPFVRLGELSYSIYLTHVFVMSVVTISFREASKILGVSIDCQRIVEGTTSTVLCFGPPWVMDIFVMAQVLLVINVSRITYVFIEAPGRRLAKSISQKHQNRCPTG